MYTLMGVDRPVANSTGRLQSLFSAEKSLELQTFFVTSENCPITIETYSVQTVNVSTFAHHFRFVIWTHLYDTFILNLNTTHILFKLLFRCH